METIGQRVDALRQGLRLTISELARRCEVTQPTMTNIIGGKTKSVKGYVLDALARELNTTTEYLLSGAQNNQDHEATMMQAELHAIFRKLPPEDQQALMRTARGMLHSSSPKASQLNPFPKVPVPVD